MQNRIDDPPLPSARSAGTRTAAAEKLDGGGLDYSGSYVMRHLLVPLPARTDL